MKKSRLIISSTALVASVATVAGVSASLISTSLTQQHKKSNVKLTIGEYDVEVLGGTSNIKLVKYNPTSPSSSTINVPGTLTADGTTYTVTELGDSLYESNQSVTTVVFPSDVNQISKIGKYCFDYCKSLCTLTNFKLCPNLEIGDYAFKDCVKLQSFVVAPTLKKIGNSSFENCSSISKITVESTPQCVSDLESIGACAFRGCTKLSLIPLFELIGTNTSKLESIGIGAFRNCSIFSWAQGYTNISIPKSCQTIGARAFEGTYAHLYFKDTVHWSTTGKREYDTNSLKPVTSKSYTDDFTKSTGLYTTKTMVKYKPVESITVSSGTATEFEQFDTPTLSATISPEDATLKDVKYSSDNNKITISDAGVVKFSGCGSDYSGNITATAQDGSNIKSSALKITTLSPIKEFDWKSGGKNSFVALNSSFTFQAEMTLKEGASSSIKTLVYSLEGADGTGCSINSTSGKLSTGSKNCEITVVAKSAETAYQDRTLKAKISVGTTLKVTTAGVCEGFTESSLADPENSIKIEFGDTLTFPSTVTSIADYAFSNSDSSNIKCPECITKLDFSQAVNCTTIGLSAFETAYSGTPKLSGTLTLANVTTIGRWAFSAQGFTKVVLGSKLSTFVEHSQLAQNALGNMSSLTEVVFDSNCPLTRIPDVFYGSWYIEKINIPKNVTTIRGISFEHIYKFENGEATFTFDDTTNKTWTYNTGSPSYDVTTATGNANFQKDLYSGDHNGFWNKG